MACVGVPAAVQLRSFPPSRSWGRSSWSTNAPSGSSSSGATCRSCARVTGSMRSRVKLSVDRVGSDLAGVKVAPDRDQAVVVLAPAERARAMPGREGGRLVQEEELGEPARLQQRTALPSPKLQLAGDPPLPVVASPDASELVVQAAAVAVDETTAGIGDQLAERRHSVLQRHSIPVVSPASERLPLELRGKEARRRR